MNSSSGNMAGGHTRVDAIVTPEGSLEVLSQEEVTDLCESGYGELQELYRRCSLAILNSGSYVDDAKAVFEEFHDFDIQLVRQQRGIRLEIKNAPAEAFVDGKMIRGIREHLFSVLRDVIYLNNEIIRNHRFDLDSSAGIINAVFNILRNADVLEYRPSPQVAVCWGGHSISRVEYDYTKVVGYQLGLRGLDVCTGCGPGAMKGPMKGAAVGHSKQRQANTRYIGISEPGIIAAEAPNPIVNQLVIMPDMEKRLEAFVRLAHGVVIFPGGAGTAEELLYLLGILMDPANADAPLPVILTAPAASADYFETLLGFIDATLGANARQRLKLIIGDPKAVAVELLKGMEAVREYRKANNDAYFFNWLLRIGEEFQTPFLTDHEQMAALNLHREQPPHELAVNLRRAFTGIVAGNVKEEGIRLVEQHGPFELRGDAEILTPLDELLASFVAAQRMTLAGRGYERCYRLVAS